MKKKILVSLLFSIGIFILYIPRVSAIGTANISIWANTSTVVVGNNVTFTVDMTSSNGGAFSAWSYTMDCSSNLVFQSGDKINELAGASNSTLTSKRFTFTFKASKSGSANCTFKINSLPDYNDPAIGQMGGTKSKSASIKIITQQELEASYSKNNNLSSLSIDGYQLSPAFNKNTLEYNVEVPNNVTKVKINATKEDGKASIQGTGEHNVSEGKNKIEIKVIAQNGSVKTYVVNVTVKELDPIVVEVNGIEYNVVRKEKEVSAPNSTFTKKTIKINDLDVPAFENTKIGYTLVGLKDHEGNIELYIYDEKNNTYTLYREFNFKSSIICIKNNASQIPINYSPTTITIDDKKVTVYQKDKSSKFYLFYGINLEDGKGNLYVYDSVEQTVQRYNNENDKIIDEHIEKEELYEYIIIGLGSLLIITYFILLISLIINSHKKRKIRKQKKSNYETSSKNIHNDSGKDLDEEDEDTADNEDDE